MEFVLRYVPILYEKDILVITSKIVALSEGRTAIYKSKNQKIKLIKQESTFAMRTKVGWLTIRDGMVMYSAGIDASNGDGKLILLPRDSFRSADRIRKVLCRKFKLKKLGVLITDSRLFPLRAGIVGVALGYAGFHGIRNYIGQKDIFGRKLKMTKTDVADSLATAAVVCTGEGREQQPLAIITDAPVHFTTSINPREMIISPKDDVYAPLFLKLKMLES